MEEENEIKIKIVDLQIELAEKFPGITFRLEPPVIKCNTDGIPFEVDIATKKVILSIAEFERTVYDS